MIRRGVIALALACLAAPGCGSNFDEAPVPPDGGWTGGATGDGVVIGDTTGSPNDLGPAPDGLPQSKEGPKISITAPAAGTTVVGELLAVKAKITDEDGVDPLSVKLALQGGGTKSMTLSSVADTYSALIDVSKLGGPMRLWVIAADFKRNQNSAVREFRRDPGPRITFLSPRANGYYKGSLSVQVVVTEPGKLDSFALELANRKLTLSRSKLGSTSWLYKGEVKFDDPYDPALTGKQVLKATAKNGNKATSRSELVFTVDDKGPALTIKSPTPGKVIGGVVTVEVEIKDGAGLLASSLRCTIGHDPNKRAFVLTASSSSANLYTGLFDSRLFSLDDLWPVLSCRAADKLGNESHMDIQLSVDNVAPAIELNPQTQIFYSRIKEGKLQCSQPIDPVGKDNAPDLRLVPQTVPLRAYVEDRGNPVRGTRVVPVAGVDKTMTWLYVLDDTSKALVVDTTGDGYCDSINPDVVPLASAPSLGDAVAVQLAGITPTGKADFRPYTGTFPSSVCTAGDDKSPPKRLCSLTELPIVPSTTYDATAAIYTIPPIGGVTCLGLPFDFGANLVSNGWACAAVEAEDSAGNSGVSPPLRLWVDKNVSASKQGSSPPGSAPPPPGCTGTYDPKTGKVDTNKSCKFRTASQDRPQRFPSAIRFDP